MDDHADTQHDWIATAQLTRLVALPDPAAATQLRHGLVCDACRQTGYAGRVGLFELLNVDEAVRHQVQARGTASDVQQAAVANGMHTLRDDGLSKALAGRTSVDEVLRVTMRASGGA